MVIFKLVVTTSVDRIRSVVDRMSTAHADRRSVRGAVIVDRH